MRAAIVSGSTVQTIVDAPAGYVPPGDLTLVWGPPAGVQAGWTYDGETWAAPVDPRTPKEIWADHAAARKDREVKAALALPDPTDSTLDTLRRKLNAALHLIQR